METRETDINAAVASLSEEIAVDDAR